MLLEKKSNDLLRDLMISYAAEIGFEYRENKRTKDSPPYLWRKVGSGFEEIGGFYAEFYNTNLRLWCSFAKRIDAIEKIWGNYYHHLNRVTSEFNPEALCTVISNPRRISDYSYDSNNNFKWIRIKDLYEVPATEDGVKALVKQIANTVNKYVLPTFEKFDTVEAIDQEMNATSERYFECIHLFTGEGLIFKKMITAKLTANPRYEEICQRMKERILMTQDGAHPSREAYLDVWQKLKANLDN